MTDTGSTWVGGRAKAAAMRRSRFRTTGSHRVDWKVATSPVNAVCSPDKRSRVALSAGFNLGEARDMRWAASPREMKSATVKTRDADATVDFSPWRCRDETPPAGRREASRENADTLSASKLSSTARR